jgi:hypothetical protein
LPLRARLAAQNYPVKHRRIAGLGDNYASRNMEAIHTLDAFEVIEVCIGKNARSTQLRRNFAERD